MDQTYVVSGFSRTSGARLKAGTTYLLWRLQRRDVRLDDLEDEVLARLTGLWIPGAAVGGVVRHDTDAEKRRLQLTRNLRRRGRLHLFDDRPVLAAEPRDPIELVVPHVGGTDCTLDNFSARVLRPRLSRCCDQRF